MRRAAAVLGLAIGIGSWPGALAGQGRMRDLELSGGFSAEMYRGNLTAVTLPVVDSTDRAEAAVGELGARGTVALLESERRWLTLAFDGGLRQFAAGGFDARDYAPREWVGRGSLSYGQPLGTWATASARLAWRGRTVEDRPPMPLFLQPGFGITSASLGLRLARIQGVLFDGIVDAEWADYSTSGAAPRLHLLDRDTRGLEVGAEWGDLWTVRFFSGFRWSEYPNQRTFDPRDPMRRDRTVQAGFAWSLFAPIRAELGIEGTVNRSNSRRPEYDALSLRTVLSVPLPLEVGATVFAVITAKSYVNDTDFKVLVPGEEADNASVVYLDLARPVAPDLDASLRLGWTRAEADVREAYYQRFGVSILLRYRPAL